jgi:hypothetical protein
MSTSRALLRAPRHPRLLLPDVHALVRHLAQLVEVKARSTRKVWNDSFRLILTLLDGEDVQVEAGLLDPAHWVARPKVLVYSPKSVQRYSALHFQPGKSSDSQPAPTVADNVGAVWSFGSAMLAAAARAHGHRQRSTPYLSVYRPNGSNSRTPMTKDGRAGYSNSRGTCTSAVKLI